jgi:hypothetical protein
MVTFVDLPTTLWSRSMGDPRNLGSGIGSGSNNKWSEKLKGSYVWPFSITLPKAVSLKDGGSDTLYRLPEVCRSQSAPMTFIKFKHETFFERHTRGQIEYEVAVRFTRAKLRPDHR